jgi:preprotein translocase subunit YajC
VNQVGVQSFVVLLLLMVAIMALIYGLKYQEDARRRKAKNDD